MTTPPDLGTAMGRLRFDLKYKRRPDMDDLALAIAALDAAGDMPDEVACDRLLASAYAAEFKRLHEALSKLTSQEPRK